MRSDEKPLRVGSSSSSWFRAWANRSYPEGKRLLLRISAVRVTLAVRRKPGQPKERRRKSGQSEHSRREGHESLGKAHETFRRAGDVEKNTAGL
jgi:hypothetical protein